jgi:hypothetical protein
MTALIVKGVSPVTVDSTLMIVGTLTPSFEAELGIDSSAMWTREESSVALLFDLLECKAFAIVQPQPFSSVEHAPYTTLRGVQMFQTWIENDRDSGIPRIVVRGLCTHEVPFEGIAAITEVTDLPRHCRLVAYAEKHSPLDVQRAGDHSLEVFVDSLDSE